MSLKERTINVDIMTKEYTKLKYKQGDSNQILKFKFYKNGSELDLTGYVAGIFYEKSNNEVLEKTGTISSNTVTTTITSGVLNTAGVVKTEIFLTKGDEVSISFTILIEVESSINKNAAVQEKEEWDIIRNLLINGNNVSLIDDSLTSANKTWSSDKINSQIKDIENNMQNVGQPTDEQINAAIYSYLENNPITIDNMWTDLVEGEIYEVQAPAKQIGIAAVFTQGGATVYANAPLDSLKPMLVVTKKYDDNTTEVTTEYSLTGELVAGTSTITVVYETFSTTFDVAVSERPTIELTSISAVYTQTSTVTPSTPLDNLKSEIVVTANYSDGTTATITNYTLSGVLVGGASTVTITYEGKTTTIDVNVIEDSSYTTDNLAGYYDLTGYADDNIGELYTGEDYTGSCPLYALDLTEYSGVDVGLVARAYVKNTSSLPDATLIGFENGEFRSSIVKYKGGEGMATRIGITGMQYPFSVEWYGKFCGDMTSSTEDSKDVYDYPLTFFTSRTTLNNITTSLTQGSTLTLTDSSTLSMSGSIGQGSGTITLSKPINKDVYHHFVVCYNQSLFQLYVDGEMIGSSTVYQNTNVNLTTPMTSGVMKMLRVYKSILTSAEVARNYNHALSTFGGGN